MSISTTLIPQNLKEALIDFIAAIRNQDPKRLNDAFGKIGTAVVSILKNFIQRIDDLIHHRHKVGPLKSETIENALNSSYSLLKTDITAACTNFQASMERIKNMMIEALKHFLHNQPILKQCSGGASKCVEVTLSTLAAGLMLAEKIDKQLKTHQSSSPSDKAMQDLKGLTSQLDDLSTKYAQNLEAMAKLQNELIDAYKQTHPNATPEDIQKFTEEFSSLVTRLSTQFTPKELQSLLGGISEKGLDAFQDFGEKGEKFLSELSKIGIDNSMKPISQFIEKFVDNCLITTQFSEIQTKLEGIMQKAGISPEVTQKLDDKASSEKSAGSYHTPTLHPPTGSTAKD